MSQIRFMPIYKFFILLMSIFCVLVRFIAKGQTFWIYLTSDVSSDPEVNNFIFLRWIVQGYQTPFDFCNSVQRFQRYEGTIKWPSLTCRVMERLKHSIRFKIQPTSELNIDLRPASWETFLFSWRPCPHLATECSKSVEVKERDKISFDVIIR